MFRPSLRCSIGTISTAMANLTIFAANTFAVYDAFGVLFLGGVIFRLFSVTATIYGDCCVARAACALPELREAHGQYKAIVDHPRAIFWEKKVAAQRLKNDRDRIFRSHRIDNTRLVLPHACAAFMSCYGLCVPAQQLRECLSSLPADSPLSFQVAGVGSCDVALPLAVTLTFLNTYDHLQRRKGFSDGLDAWIRQINKYGTVAWTLLTFVTLCTHFAGCVAFLPPHVAPVWLGISVTSACKSLIVNHTAPMRALFGIRDYPKSHGVCRAMSTAEVHEYRLAFTGVDVEERHSMWQTQKKALDYECNVRLYRMLGRMGLFDRVEEAEHEAKNLQRKLNMARSRRKEQELKRKEGRGDEGEKEAMIKTPPIRGEDIVGPSADAVAEHCYDDLQVEENERRRQRRQMVGALAPLVACCAASIPELLLLSFWLGYPLRKREAKQRGSMCRYYGSLSSGLLSRRQHDVFPLEWGGVFCALHTLLLLSTFFCITSSPLASHAHAVPQVTRQMAARCSVRGIIQPLTGPDALKIRAAHHIPNFAVAVEGAYQLLRSLTGGGTIRRINVVASPCSLNFTMELLLCFGLHNHETAGGANRASWLSYLLALSQEMKLQVGLADTCGRHPFITQRATMLYEGRWSQSEPPVCEPAAASICALITKRLGAKLRQLREGSDADLPAFVLRGEVLGLFCGLPVRRVAAARLQRGTGSRLRREQQAVLMVLYRIAAECLLAPLYFQQQRVTVDDNVSLCLHLWGDSSEEGGGAMSDTADAIRVHVSSTEGVSETRHPVKRQRHDTQTDEGSPAFLLACSTVWAFLPYFTRLAAAVGFERDSDILRLREVVVAAARFAVVYHSRCVAPRTRAANAHDRVATTRMGGVVVISMHENSGACYVVDERHHVYRHAGAFPSQLQLLLVFVAEDILEGAENDLRRMFQLAARRHYQVAMPDQTTVTSNENIGALNVIGSLSGTKGDIGRCDAVSSGLRVSLLTSRLAVTDRAAARGRREGCSRSAGSAPRRTPFCPIKLTLPTHSINILPKLRKTMQVTVNPAVVAQRAYDAPVVWAGNGGAKGERHTTCPFRAGHFIGQWDHKFLLLHKNDALDRKRENLTYPSVLYISDQHAVHERLRLEYFIVNAESYLELPSSSPTFFAVKIPDDICRDVTDYEVALQQWGWRFSYSTADRGTPRLCVAVRHWPNLVVEGHRLHLEGIGALRRTVEEFSVVSQTRGAHTDGAGVIPSAVLQFLITRSCRGALMFGDRLEERHAALLIDSLRAVSQYCVCSHGRPAFAAVQCLRPPRVQLPA